MKQLNYYKMKAEGIKLFTLLSVILLTIACEDDASTDLSEGLDKFVIGTNITTSNPVIGYVGTLKDLSVAAFDNSKSRQATQYPYVTLYKNDVFVMPSRYGDIVRKYTRQSDGTLLETGSLNAPSASNPLGTVIESDTKGYCSLFGAGKIVVFNPSTMAIIETIDLTSYGLGGDGNPDPSVMEFHNGKLYVACTQTTD